MPDLDEILLNDLRTGGPWRLEELVRDLNERSRLELIDVGIVGASAVLDSLRRLKAAGRAVEVEAGWEWRPERLAKPTGRTVQESLF